jgi:flotillin
MDNEGKTNTLQDRWAKDDEERRHREALRQTEAERKKKAEEDEKRRLFMYGAGAILIGSATAFLFTRYKTSKSNEWLVKTGILVNDMQIGKKFFQLPFQNIQRIIVTPTNYHLNINSMSKEKMEFKFPIVFTMGPKVDEESLTKYSRFMLNLDDKDTVIKGIIEGEARALAANISIEEIFAGRNEFKNNIINHVQPQLDQYGIAIYNANIEELRDSESSNYFKSLALRIKAEAENKAKVQVAEQNKHGQIGSKEREAETRQRIATVESETMIIENQRKQEMLKSAADLEKTTAEQEMIINLAKIRSQNEAEKIKMDMECEVEAKRQKMEVERVRATELSKTLVEAEKVQKEAEGYANAQKIKADAVLYAKMKDAEGVLYAKTKEAEGLSAMYEAQSSGIHKLVSSFGGDRQSLISYMMLEKDQFTKLADSSAKAIQGLQPKITIWNTDANKDGNPYSGIANLGQSIVPMLDTIKEQTGYALPDWLIKDGTMPGKGKAPELR